MNGTAHTELVASELALPPGDGYVTLFFPIDGKQFLFKPTGAERVEGIDYDAFKIRSVWICSTKQCGGFSDPFPSTEFFKPWGIGMTIVQPGLDIAIRLRNTSDKPQPFAVKLVGRILY